MHSLKKFLVPGVFLIIVMGFYGASLLGQNDDYKYTPLPTEVFVDKDTIQTWIVDHNLAEQRAHSWGLWEALTRDSGYVVNGTHLPVWDTWYTPADVFQPEPSPDNTLDMAHKFNPFNQLVGVHTEASTDNVQQDLIGFNKFNLDYVEHIWDNEYQNYDVLKALQSSCDPNAICKIKDFPATGVAMKPVFYPVADNAVTIVPVWAGLFPSPSDASSTASDATTSWTIDSPEGAPPSTWFQCVALDLREEGALNPGEVISGFVGTYYDQNGNPSPTPGDDITLNVSCTSATVVSLDDFYHFNLTQDEVDGMNANQSTGASGSTPNVLDTTTNIVGQRPLQVGDHAIFVASHITTREIDNWVWMTMWWSQNPNEYIQAPIQYMTVQDTIRAGAMYNNYPGGGEDRPDTIQAPWNNYVMCTNYQYVDPLPDGTASDPGAIPEFCFNPYLETNFSESDVPSGGGMNSNCMACHGNANWSDPIVHPVTPIPKYISAQYIPRDASQFHGVVQLDFAWSISVNVAPTPTPTSTP